MGIAFVRFFKVVLSVVYCPFAARTARGQVLSSSLFLLSPLCICPFIADGSAPLIFSWWSSAGYYAHSQASGPLVYRSIISGARFLSAGRRSISVSEAKLSRHRYWLFCLPLQLDGRFGGMSNSFDSDLFPFPFCAHGPHSFRRLRPVHRLWVCSVCSCPSSRGECQLCAIGFFSLRMPSLGSLLLASYLSAVLVFLTSYHQYMHSSSNRLFFPHVRFCCRNWETKSGKKCFSKNVISPRYIRFHVHDCFSSFRPL